MRKTYEYNLSDLRSVADDIIKNAGDIRVWTFTGDLGAGKTTLIKSLASVLGSTDTVSSPTYTIVNQYVYPDGNIYHIDAYRIEDDEEAFDIGLEDIIHSDEYVWIEWPQKIEHFIPEQSVSIEISILNEGRILDLEIK